MSISLYISVLAAAIAMSALLSYWRFRRFEYIRDDDITGGKRREMGVRVGIGVGVGVRVGDGGAGRLGSAAGRGVQAIKVVLKIGVASGRNARTKAGIGS